MFDEEEHLELHAFSPQEEGSIIILQLIHGGGKKPHNMTFFSRDGKAVIVTLLKAETVGRIPWIVHKSTYT